MQKCVASRGLLPSVRAKRKLPSVRAAEPEAINFQPNIAFIFFIFLFALTKINTRKTSEKCPFSPKISHFAPILTPFFVQSVKNTVHRVKFTDCTFLFTDCTERAGKRPYLCSVKKQKTVRLMTTRQYI